MSGRIKVAFVDFAEFSSGVDRGRYALMRSYLVRNWCGGHPHGDGPCDRRRPLGRRSREAACRWRGYCERSDVHTLYWAILSRVTSFDGTSSTVDAGFCPSRMPTRTFTAPRALKSVS